MRIIIELGPPKTFYSCLEDVGIFHHLMKSMVKISLAIKERQLGDIIYLQLDHLILCQKESKIKVMVWII
jgi:hypothetical protein